MPFPVVVPPSGPDESTNPFQRRLVWLTDHEGVRVYFDVASGYSLLYGSKFGPAPAEVTTVRRPEYHGSSFRGVRLPQMEVFVPFAVEGSSTAELRERLLHLERKADPLRGPVTITVAQSDAEYRECTGYAVVEEGDYDIDYQLASLTVACPDPFWYGPAVSLEFRAEGTTKSLLANGDEFFPIRLGSSQVVGEVTINNPGDAPAYAVWTFQGPMNGIEVINHSVSDQAFEVTGTVGSGDEVIVDTRRDRQTVRDQDGENLYASLVQEQMFPLVPGDNVIEFVIGSATEDTRMLVAFNPPYRAA